MLENLLITYRVKYYTGIKTNEKISHNDIKEN